MVGDACKRGNVSADADATLLQPLLAQSTGDAHGGGEPPGEVTAACHILKAPILDLGGVVRMTGPGAVPQSLIISRAGIFISDHRCNGRSAGIAVYKAGQKFRPVAFLPAGSQGSAARCTAGQKFAQFLFINSQSGGDAVQSHADGWAVGLAKNRQFQEFSIGTAHKIPPKVL